jgi:arylsulfatase
MTRTPPHRSAAGLAPASWPAFVGLQFGIVELALLAWGRFRLGPGDIGEIVLVYGLAGLALGLPAWVATLLGRRGLESESGWGPRLRRALPALWTLVALAGLYLNKKVFPELFSPLSLAGNLALLLAGGGLLFAWARRPWGRRADRVLAAAVLTLDLAAVAFALGRPAATAPAREPPSAAAGAPDLLLVLVDTLRPDHLGAYGYPRDTSPRLDRLAAEGVVFERAYSTSNWTRPVVASLLTSTMPSRHGVTSLRRALAPALPLVTEALQGGGYRTGVFTSGTNVEPADGYDRGVDAFWSAGTRRPAERTFLVHRVLPALRRRPADPTGVDPARITDRALGWLATVPADRPAFLYLHYQGPHKPYFAPASHDLFAGGPERGEPAPIEPPATEAGASALSERDRQRLIAAYDGEIRWHDHELGRLIDRLVDMGRPRPAVALITSDHGEAFGEHGVWTHGLGLFEEIVRVPLVLWSSRERWPARRVATPVSLLDLAPTLCRLAGVDPPASFDGGTLLPLLTGPEAERTVFMENPATAESGLRDPSWAFFQTGAGPAARTWLYAAADTLQTENLAPARPEVVDRLRARVAERQALDRSAETAAPTLELDAERRERLRALGYLD